METSIMSATSAFRVSRNEAGKGIGVAVAAVFCLAGSAAGAQSAPDVESGRYALSPVADGVLRLDTRTGAASFCGDKGAGWACYVMPDERAAASIDPRFRPCADHQRTAAACS